MILHTVPGSPNGRKVEAVISHLGLEVEIRHRNLFNGELRGPDYLALNANAKAPTLVDGDFTLWETTAIMQYLCEKAGDSTLFPRSPRMRADITRWQCWEGLYFNAALGTLAFETLAKAKYNIGPADAVLVEQARATLFRFAPVLNAHLEGRKYLVDDRLTLAVMPISDLASDQGEVEPGNTGTADGAGSSQRSPHGCQRHSATGIGAAIVERGIRIASHRDWREARDLALREGG